MSIFHYLQTIAIKIDMAIKIHLKECPHGDPVPATILDAIGVLMKGKVVLNGAARIFGLFILSRSEP